VITPTAMKLIEERGNLCECCGIRQGTEAHHALYYKDNKNLRAKKLLDMTYNLILVCERCHSCKAKTHQSKVRFWEIQCARYGHDVMVAWHNKIPYKQENKVLEYK